jgi:hypothetical protein
MLRPCGRFFFGTVSALKPSACEGVKNDRTTRVLVVAGQCWGCRRSYDLRRPENGAGRPGEIQTPRNTPCARSDSAGSGDEGLSLRYGQKGHFRKEGQNLC